MKIDNPTLYAIDVKSIQFPGAIMYSARIARNIPLDYSFTFISNFNLLHALWMIYLHAKGFSLLDLGILEGTFHITSFLMEVPTGAVADLRGRKQSRSLGRVFALLSLFFLRFSTSLKMQMAGFVLSAVSYNLESGAGEALVYDSLKSLGIEAGYKRIAGRRELIYQLASASAIPVGGYLASRISYDTVFLFMAVVISLSLINTMFMTEPPLNKESSGISGHLMKRILHSIVMQTTESLKVIRRNPRVALLILFTESIFVFITTFYYYLQTYWKEEGMSEFRIGIVIAFQCLVSGVCGLYAQRAEKRFGETGLLVILPLIQLFCLWGMALSAAKTPFYILTGISEGILFVAVSDYINSDIPSLFRATILSFRSMVFSILMIVLFPFLGWMGERWNLESGFIFCAATALLLYLFFLKYSLPVIKNMK